MPSPRAESERRRRRRSKSRRQGGSWRRPSASGSRTRHASRSSPGWSNPLGRGLRQKRLEAHLVIAEHVVRRQQRRDVGTENAGFGKAASQLCLGELGRHGSFVALVDPAALLASPTDRRRVFCVGAAGRAAECGGQREGTRPFVALLRHVSRVGVERGSQLLAKV